jgi:monofunctional glycosyltransferase
MKRFFALLTKWLLAVALLSVAWVAIYIVVAPPVTLTMLLDSEGATRSWRPLRDIDPDMARAAIAAEDSRFCQHNGFDFVAMGAALARNASGGRVRGGSTISQQVAKNVFLWQGSGTISRTLRKVPEAWFTFLIEALWGKRRIMEVYLNVAETGIGTYGVEAGAKRYFHHSASVLSPTEAARIAAVLPLPQHRGAIAPRGFTRRYGNSIAARIGVVRRERLDACLR